MSILQHVFLQMMLFLGCAYTLSMKEHNERIRVAYRSQNFQRFLVNATLLKVNLGCFANTFNDSIVEFALQRKLISMKISVGARLMGSEDEKNRQEYSSC